MGWCQWARGPCMGSAHLGSAGTSGGAAGPPPGGSNATGKKRETNGFHFFPPFCLPYIPILNTIPRLIQYFIKLSGLK